VAIVVFCCFFMRRSSFVLKDDIWLCRDV
jgi:hypothetical protein